MIHPKLHSPSYNLQRRQRQTNSGRTLSGSAKTVQYDEPTIPTEPEEPVPIRYSDLYKQEKARAEMHNMLRKKKSFPIAPDALIPNSTSRTMFKKKEIKPIEAKIFKLRLDILENLQNKSNKNLNWQDDDDDEWMELTDPDASSKPTSAKKSKGTLVSRQKKETIPDLFKRMQNEIWWKQSKDEKSNLRSMLIYLSEILKLKQLDSFESACIYVVEIFRNYGIEPVIVNQILDILLDDLNKDENDPLDICTINTIAQFMIERKDIIIRLLEYALKYQSTDTLRQEIINAVKFITDVNNSDDINLVLDNISIVRDSSDENFSLKMIINGLDNKKNIVILDAANEGEETDEIHPLLKKISEERWFPRERFSITLDSVITAIITKLSDITKTMLKTLTTHLVQLHRVIGYSKEQFDRISNSIISLLSHNEADYRLIAATTLANFNKETKSIDIALLNSFVNDPRILVRTECCDTLKKLTGITSDVVLKDCADDISFLQTLSEDNFTVGNYLKEKNRLPTPPSIDEQSSLLIEEENITKTENEQNLIIDINSYSPHIDEQPSIINSLPLPSVPPESNEFSAISSLISSITSVQEPIRVEIIEKQNSIPSHVSKERTPILQREQPIVPTKTSISDQTIEQGQLLLPNNPNMWNSYAKQYEMNEQKINDESKLDFFPVPHSTIINQEQINDPVEIILNEHKNTVGFYRMIPNRPLLIPHKISMDNIFSDQSHIIIDQNLPQLLSSSPMNAMNLLDLNQNQHHLNEVEFVQLLSSLVVRSVQIHKKSEKFNSGAFSTNFTDVLNISQAHLHSSSNLNPLTKLPPIIHQQPTSSQLARIRADTQARATKAGINLHKAQIMENTLSNLLKSNRELTKSITTQFPSISRKTDVTHAWLLIQLLKSQGTLDSENYIQQIIRSYPKFIPLLHTRIPQNLVSIIWNDPIMKQISSIFGNTQDETIIENYSIKRSNIKPSVSIINDQHSLNHYDYSTLIHRDDNKKKFLPPIRGSKMHLPRHVLKFGFREIDNDLSDLSNNSSRDDNRSRSRKRRVYMHFMMPSNENTYDRNESVKSQLRQMLKTDYQATSYVPIVVRPPMCH